MHVGFTCLRASRRLHSSSCFTLASRRLRASLRAWLLFVLWFSSCFVLRASLLFVFHCSSCFTVLRASLFFGLHYSSRFTTLHASLLFVLHCSWVSLIFVLHLDFDDLCTSLGLRCSFCCGLALSVILLTTAAAAVVFPFSLLPPATEDPHWAARTYPPLVFVFGSRLLPSGEQYTNPGVAITH